MMDDERPVPRKRKPGIGVDPSKLDMTPHIREGVPMPPATEEDIMRYKFLMGPNSPLASSSVSPTGSSNLQVAMDSMRPDSFLHTYMADNNLVSSLDPQGELLLRALQKGEIGDPNSPRIKKAIEDLQRQKYGAGGRAQNQEVMGPVEQEFARFADPEDGTLVAADPSFVIPREVSPQEVKQINRRVISDYEKKKEMLRRGLLAPLLRGV